MRHRVPLSLALLSGAAAVFLAGCGGGGSPPPLSGGTGGLNSGLTGGFVTSGLVAGGVSAGTTGATTGTTSGNPPPPPNTSGTTGGASTGACAPPAGIITDPGGITDPTGGPVLPSGIRSLNLVTNDLVYDPVSGKIYASVPSTAGASGNSIVAIDPVTGMTGAPVFVGSEPNKLAISTDDQYLYIGLDGAAAIRRFDLASNTPELQVPLGNANFGGPLLAADIQVQPGHPHTIAVVLRARDSSPGNAGTVIYDDAVARPGRPPLNWPTQDVIQFSANGSLLYGLDNVSSGFEFTRLYVGACGLSLLDSTNSAVQHFFSTIRYDNGLIYTSDGDVINPNTRDLVGTYDIQAGYSLVAPDALADRVYFLSGPASPGGSGFPSNAGPYSVLTFDAQTFLPLAALTVPGVSLTPGTFPPAYPSSFIRVGANGLAFRTPTQVFLIAPLPGA